MSIHEARPEHEVAYQDIVALVGKHADKMDAVEFLAVAANMIGKLIAMQDQRTMTRELAIEILMKNIEKGNEQVVEELKKNASGTRN